MVAHWARATPHKVAVYENDRVVTFAALWSNVEAAQTYLRSQGVKSGERVLIVAENCLAVVTLLFALTEIGAWPVVVSAKLSGQEVEVIRAISRPRLMLFTHAASPDALRHGIRNRAMEVSPAGLGLLMAVLVDDVSAPEPEAIARDVAALVYTSGATAHPKCAMVTHRGLMHSARVSADASNMGRDDCVYTVMHMSNIFGLATSVLATFHAGASIYLPTRFKAAEVCAALRCEAITIVQGAPRMFEQLVAFSHDHDASYVSKRLRYLCVIGGPLNVILKRNVEERFGLPLHQGYGITEYSGFVAMTGMKRPRADEACGEVVTDAEIRITGPDGAAVSPGVVGQLWVRGPGVMRGYYGAPKMTAEVLRPDGWFISGDLARLGPDGALNIVGRTRDPIVRSGCQVHPKEAESVFNSYPAGQRSDVFGLAADEGSEMQQAFR